MKKPKSVIIQGHTYKIISDNSEICEQELADSEYGLRGCVKYNDQVIYISPDQNDESWFLTLIHEIFHTFQNHMGHKDNEKLTDHMATAMFTFLKENKLWKI